MKPKMPRTSYAFDELFPGDRGGMDLSTGSARGSLSRAMREAWASPQMDNLRFELRQAGRRLAPGYSRAAQGIRRAYSDIARNSGAADAYRAIWDHA